MRKRGIVKKAGMVAEVGVVRQSACGENCANCGGCVLTETVITAENSLGAKAGDRVVLEVADKTALWATGVVYILPIIILLAALAVAFALELSEGTTAIAAVGALLLAFGIVKLLGKKEVTVKIIEILD